MTQLSPNVPLSLSTWGSNNLTQIAGGSPAADAPFGYLTDFGGQGPTARVIYRGTDDNVWELNYLGPNP